MSVDAAALRLAWWLHRPAGGEAQPAPVPPERIRASAESAETLRPAAELETRLLLRDIGWRG